MKIILFFFGVVYINSVFSIQKHGSKYICENGKCLKSIEDASSDNHFYSFYECRMICGPTIGTLWPKISGSVFNDKKTKAFDLSDIVFNTPPLEEWSLAKERFLKQLSNKVNSEEPLKPSGNILNVSISHNVEPDSKLKLTLETDESYQLDLTSSGNEILVKIAANSFFGARHGLETLMQLIFYDDITNELKTLATASIYDKPKYKWRGIAVDTARNFVSVDTIKTIIDGMAMSKLNTFHWHITDSQSFPLELLSLPEMSLNGAYKKNKIYRQDQIKDIIQYALARGIRVLPEFDAPAHVGEGWQHLDVLVCFKKQPWKNFCVEPPCGQLDPTSSVVYDTLEKIYREMVNLFDVEAFHMGGDEVSVDCWNTSSKIQNWMLNKGWKLNEDGFMKLWNHFQEEALNRFLSVTNGADNPIILWTSRLTEKPYVDLYLDPNRYIIQIWSTGDDPKITELHKRGFRTIISNYDALYLDCGGPGWVQGGQNWCSPYKGWQQVYSNRLEQIGGRYNDLIMGAEAAVWSEQIDDYTILQRTFPRISAMAERLWFGGDGNWQDSESRMLLHRELLVENGIPSESLQPEWCLQNENECPIDSHK